jgi:hypothetical protein
MVAARLKFLMRAEDFSGTDEVDLRHAGDRWAGIFHRTEVGGSGRSRLRVAAAAA